MELMTRAGKAKFSHCGEGFFKGLLDVESTNYHFHNWESFLRIYAKQLITHLTHSAWSLVSFEIGMPRPCQDHNWRSVWFAPWKLCECSLPSLLLTCVTAWQVGASLACLMTDCELFQPPMTTSYPSQPSHGASSTRASAAARTWNSISTSTENWQSKVGKIWNMSKMGKIWNMSESRISILFCWSQWAKQ